MNISEEEKLAEFGPHACIPPDIAAILENLIEKNPDKFEQAKKKPTLIGWFLGKVMQASRGGANPKETSELIVKRFGLENV